MKLHIELCNLQPAQCWPVRYLFIQKLRPLDDLSYDSLTFVTVPTSLCRLIADRAGLVSCFNACFQRIALALCLLKNFFRVTLFV